MRIVDHRLEGVRFITSPNGGGIITPKFLVMHFTADWRAQSAINYFLDPSRKVSAHIILDRDGTLTQMVPFNQRAWHAGKSYWRGHSGLNDSSIGIEVVNYGPTPLSDANGRPLTREGRAFPDSIGDPKGWVRAEHVLEKGRVQWWQKFTEAQYDVLDELTPLIVDTYNIREVVGHDEIAIHAGRKTDPGPAFPLAHYKQFADHGNAASEGRYVVIVDDLNVRGGPGVSYGILTKLQRGNGVKVLQFEDNGWALVTVDNHRGWVHASFLMKA